MDELGRLEHHLDVEEGDCGCVEVECDFGAVGCVAKLPRKDLQRHKEENVHKHLVLMSVMSLKSNEAFVKELREQRMEFQQQLKRKDEEMQAVQKSLQQQIEEKNEQLKVLQGHMNQQVAAIQEQLEQNGKANKMKFDDVERKQQEDKQEIEGKLGQVETSLGGQVKEVKELIGQVESSLEENEHLVKEVNEKIQTLEKHTFIPPPDFTVTDFEQHKKDGDDWFSPPFYSHIGGYKMCLRVCAKGQGEGKGTHVSLSVHMMRGEYDAVLKWPFHGDLEVKVLNQRIEKGHVKYAFHITDEIGGRVTEHERAAMGFGFVKCIAHSALGYDSYMNTEYLRNDCLKFRVTKATLKNL